MTEATEQRRGNGLTRATKRLRRQAPSTSQTGATLFPHVVWAHHQWERRLHADKIADAGLEQTYQSMLADFQREQGKVEQVYWSTQTASAVAMTVKLGRPPRPNPLHLRERDSLVRFHRVTDWVTRDAPLVADLLHECDLLASRVEQVLRGTSQRIAMRWILGIAMHLLGFLERDSATADRASEERTFVEAQRLKLTEVEAYYHRAASQAGRIVYASGMLVGLLFIAVLGVVAAWLLGTSDMSAAHRKLTLLCYGAGAIGALVSTMSRMGNPVAGKFNVDFELGRPLIRRLGLFRPVVGGVFGVALFFLLASGLLDLKPGSGLEPYYYGIAAFLAGFSERFATGMLSGAEHRLVPTEPAAPGRPVQPGESSAPESV